MLVDKSSISRISVNSKKNSYKSKGSPSTEVPESPNMKHTDSQEFPSCQDYWTAECQDVKIRNLEDAINGMEQYQMEMEAKFQKCIQQMLGQIEKNNESNSRLAVEVNKLKTEVSQSKKDILIIEEFLTNNQKKAPKAKHGQQNGAINRLSSSRDLMGSLSKSKTLLSRRQSSKLFKSKLFPKQ